MRPGKALVATLATLAIAAPANAAPDATIRIETVAKELVPAVGSGSVRSYVDTDGNVHKLASRTALGQIVALGAARNVPVNVHYFASFNAGIVERFGSGRQSATGGWNFAVNGIPSQVGGDLAIIPRGAEVVWWMIDDFSTQGSWVPLDLDLVSNRRGRVTLRVTKFDSATGKVIGAKGAKLRVDGRTLTVPASGNVTVRIKRGKRFHARATAPSTIRSEQVSGTA